MALSSMVSSIEQQALLLPALLPETRLHDKFEFSPTGELSRGPLAQPQAFKEQILPLVAMTPSKTNTPVMKILTMKQTSGSVILQSEATLPESETLNIQHESALSKPLNEMYPHWPHECSGIRADHGSQPQKVYAVAERVHDADSPLGVPEMPIRISRDVVHHLKRMCKGRSHRHRDGGVGGVTTRDGRVTWILPPGRLVARFLPELLLREEVRTVNRLTAEIEFGMPLPRTFEGPNNPTEQQRLDFLKATKYYEQPPDSALSTAKENGRVRFVAFFQCRTPARHNGNRRQATEAPQTPGISQLDGGDERSCDFTEGDLNTSRFNQTVAAAGDRDPAIMAGLEGATMRPMRARHGFEGATASWQNFHLNTDNLDQDAVWKGDLHAGQLHRLNRVVRGERPGADRIVAVAPSAALPRPAVPFLGTAQAAPITWSAGMLASVGSRPGPVAVAAVAEKEAMKEGKRERKREERGEKTAEKVEKKADKKGGKGVLGGGLGASRWAD